MMTLGRVFGLAAALVFVSACGGGGGGDGGSGGGTQPTSFTVSTSTTGTGSGTISPTSRSVTQGNTTSFTISPASGSNIGGVSGCGGSLSGTTYTTGPINGNCTVSATFNLNTYTVTATAGSGGSISPTSANVTHGDTAAFSVTPSSGFAIDSVSGCGGALSGSTYTTGSITAACTVTASFAATVAPPPPPPPPPPATFTVSTTTSGTGSGTITPGSATVGQGQTASFTITPSTGSEIESVSGCNGSLTGNTYTTGAINANCTVAASFRTTTTPPPGTYTVTTTTSGNGTGSITPGSATVEAGQTASFQITAGEGSTITSVTGCGGSLNGSTYTTGPINSDCLVTATFTLNTYTVTAVAGEGGSISPTSVTVGHGSTTSFTVTPETGYSIASVTGCGGGLNGTTYTTGLITSACTVNATFNLNTYEVMASAGPGGTVSPASVMVEHGSTASFSVIPDTGYRIASVSGCGGSLDGTTYRTAPITGDCVVEAQFEAVERVNLVASAGDRSVVLEWNDIGADQYDLYYATDPAFNPENYQSYPDSSLRLGVLSPHNETGLINETTYYFLIEARKNGSWRTFSDRIAATPVAPLPLVPGQLNDTGVETCGNQSLQDVLNNNMLSCDETGATQTSAGVDIYGNQVPAGQDALFGRDAAAREGRLVKLGGGDAGFDFTKLDSNGEPLEIQDAQWEEAGKENLGTQWSCVLDNRTGLVWETKVNDPNHLRDGQHVYSWYNPDITSNGGSAGVQNNGICAESDCDTAAFLEAVNAVALCGARDWRLPNVEELLNLVHNGNFGLGRGIDRHFFPNGSASHTQYYTSDPVADSPQVAWSVLFGSGEVWAHLKSGTLHIRLVRAGYEH